MPSVPLYILHFLRNKICDTLEVPSFGEFFLEL